MKPHYILKKYKACILNAKSAFNHYEKYSTCFAIRSLDDEMLSVFRKMGLSYAKLMQLVFKRNAADNIDTIDECESLIKEKQSFFNRISNFLDKNEEQIGVLLTNRNCLKAVKAELEVLEKNVTLANQLVERMDLMLRSSQHIYLRAATPELKSA